MSKKLLILTLTMLLAFGTTAAALAAPKLEPPGQTRKRAELEGEKGILAGETVREHEREREEAAGQPDGPGQKALQVKQRNQTRTRILAPEEGTDLKERPLQERLRIRGMNLKFDMPPVIKYGRTLVPVRAISQGLGAEVAWDPETMTVTITRGDTVITLALGSREMLVNGEPVVMDVPAELISNRTLVPIRFIAAALGERIGYDQETGDIDIGESEEEELSEGAEEAEEATPSSSAGDSNEESSGVTGQDTP